MVCAARQRLLTWNKTFFRNRRCVFGHAACQRSGSQGSLPGRGGVSVSGLCSLKGCLRARADSAASEQGGKEGVSRGQVLGSLRGGSGLWALPWGLSPPSSWQEALCHCSQPELTSRPCGRSGLQGSKQSSPARRACAWVRGCGGDSVSSHPPTEAWPPAAAQGWGCVTPQPAVRAVGEGRGRSRVLASWRRRAGLCGPWPRCLLWEWGRGTRRRPHAGRLGCDGTPESRGSTPASLLLLLPRLGRLPCPCACPLRVSVPGPRHSEPGALAGARPGWPGLVALTQPESQLVWDPWEPEERVRHRPNSRPQRAHGHSWPWRAGCTARPLADTRLLLLPGYKRGRRLPHEGR